MESIGEGKSQWTMDNGQWTTEERAAQARLRYLDGDIGEVVPWAELKECVKARWRRVVELDARYRSYWKRAVRCLLASPGRDWRDVAIAEQAALRICVAERDALTETLRTTTQDMNRYFEYWQAASRHRVGTPLPSDDVLVRIHRLAYGQALPDGRTLYAWERLTSEDRAAHDTAMRAVLSALAPHLVGGAGDLAAVRQAQEERDRMEVSWQQAVAQVADLQSQLTMDHGRWTTKEKESTADVPGISRKGEETIETLRGRLAQFSESVKRESRGRLEAETMIGELEGRLASERRGAGLALDHQGKRYEVRLQELRENHSGEMTGLRSMLAELERRAWHGRLMVAALSLGMEEGEYARLEAECWGLMKRETGVIDNGRLTMDNGEEIQMEEHRESARERVTITPGESPGPKCSSCGEVLSEGNRYLLASGNYNCEECWDVAMTVAASKGGAS